MSPVIALAAHQHAAGCPAQRLETYEARRPTGEFVTVSRCIDCGAHVVHGGTLRDVISRLSRKERDK